MRRSLVVLCLSLSLSASAQVPSSFPVQGYLTDSAGTPLAGVHAVLFTLYDAETGGTSFFSELLVVTVVAGAFTAHLSVNPSLFKDRAGFLGIKVGADPELAPRLRLGTVPYAAYAEAARNGVPAGAVMFFDLPACPSGWSDFAAARGRTLVGTPDAGTAGGTVGAALANLEDRTHAHAVDPAAATTTSDGAHTHVVDPVSVGHQHSVDPASFDTATVTHNHAWASWSQLSRSWFSFNANGNGVLVYTWTDGMDTNGAGEYPLSAPNVMSATYFTTHDTHAHAIDVPSTTTSTGTIDVPATTSTTSGSHSHAVDVGPTLSSATSGAMPYVQLVSCRKN